MKLTCACWSFPALTLEEVAGLSRVLGIGAIDVGVDYRSALDRQQLLIDPERVAARLRQLGVDVPCCYYRFGNELATRNIADPANLRDNLDDLRKVLRFCAAAGIPTLFILPGIVNPGQTTASAIAASAEALRQMVPHASEAGVTLTIEAHVQSIVESPALAGELLQRVPGLKLTLDYSHFICLGYRQDEVDPLAEHAAHVHLRQAKPGELQAKFDEGTINFPALLGRLRSVGYEGYLSLENVHQRYMNTLFDDVLTETVQMRDLVRAYL